MEFKDKIKKLRSELNLTLEEVAKKVKVSPPTIQRYESGEIKNVRRDKIKLLADALQTTPAYLMDWDDGPVYDGPRTIAAEDFKPIYRLLILTNRIFIYIFVAFCTGRKKVLDYSEYVLFREQPVKEVDGNYYAPILGQTAAGRPIEYGDPITNPEMIAVPKNADMALRINGDSMEPEYLDGDTVFIHLQPDIENGQIGVVEIEGAVTCKKVIKSNSHIELHSLNKKYSPIIINGGQFRILGRVIGKA